MFLAIFFLNGCVNLKKFNEFSSTSVKSLKKFEELGYSFTRACNEKCELEQLEKQLLNTRCKCNADNDADSVTLALYKVIKGYFEGLTKLSDNELTSYKFNGLTKALKEGDFGGVKINKSHIDAYGKISTILTRAVTNAYRKNKLTEYTGEANEAIKILLDALSFNLVSNLSKKLDIKKQIMESYYFDMLNDSTLSTYEKKKIIEEFNASLVETGNRKKLITSYSNGLRSIAEGHQMIYKNRNKLKSKELLVILVKYSSDIQDLVDEFNMLKN